MTMGNKENIRGVLSVHVVLLDGADLLNEIINAVGDLLRGPERASQIFVNCNGTEVNDLLSVLTAITPDIPRLLGIETMLLSQGTDILGQHAFVQTIIPLSKSASLGDLVCIFQGLLIGIIKGKLKGLHCTPAWTDVDVGNVGWVNQFARTNNHLAGCENLVFSVFGELKLGDAGVASILGPLGLACDWLDYSGYYCITGTYRVGRGRHGVCQRLCRAF
jgi:hypothetical protein